MLKLTDYVAHAYSEDVAIYLNRMIEQLHVTFSGWDEYPIIEILTRNDGTNLDLMVRESIVLAHHNVLMGYGVTLVDSSLSLQWMSLDVIINIGVVNNMYLDPIETFIEFISIKHGVDKDRLYIHFDKVEQSTVLAMAEAVQVASKLQINGDKYNKLFTLTTKYGHNAAITLVSSNVPIGLTIDYYISLLDTPLRTTSYKHLALDVHSIMLLVSDGVDVKDMAKDYIEALDLDKVFISKSISTLLKHEV